MKRICLTPSEYDELIIEEWIPDKIIDAIDETFPNNDCAYDFECTSMFVLFKVDGTKYILNGNYTIEEDTL